MEPRSCEAAHGVEHWDKSKALLRKLVHGTRRKGLDVRSSDESSFSEELEPLTKRPRTDPLERTLQVPKVAGAAREVANEQQCPFPADDLGTSADGTFESRFFPHAIQYSHEFGESGVQMRALAEFGTWGGQRSGL